MGSNTVLRNLALAIIVSAALAAPASSQTGQQKPADSSKPAAPPATAPPTAPPAAPPATRPVTPTPQHASGIQALGDDAIKLEPGDVIQIDVDNHPMLNGVFTIPGVGRLLLPEAGEVPVAGLTVPQFRDKLQAELEKTLNNVFVRVLATQIHSRHVALTGVVLHQGNFDMSTNVYHLLDLLDVAGGLAPPLARADAQLTEYRATLYRNANAIPIDLQAAYSRPLGDQNFVIEPNDRINIELLPRVTHELHILGEIPRQGNYPLDNNTTVLGLFGQAGFPSVASSLSTSYVLRGPRKIPLDLRPILTGNVDLAINKFKFEDEDILYIPRVTTQYMVWGQVGKQGTYVYPEAGKVRLLDAIETAGETGGGEYRKVQLIRSVNGKQTITSINVDRMIRKGVDKDNLLLEPNDTVFVPPKKHVYTPQLADLFQPLILLSYFGIRPY